MDDHDNRTGALATLHTRVIDACKGYEEGRERAETPEMTALFGDLLEMHRAHAADLANALTARGVVADPDGSFLQYVHKAVLKVRSAFGRLDETAVPGIVDGEDRLLELYDETRITLPDDAELDRLLERQRDDVARQIQRLRVMESGAEA